MSCPPDAAKADTSMAQQEYIYSSPYRRPLGVWFAGRSNWDLSRVVSEFHFIRFNPILARHSTSKSRSPINAKRV